MKRRYLLYQLRKAGDPMIIREIESFARTLECSSNQINTVNLIERSIHVRELIAYDMVLIGGSGDYSIPTGGQWYGRAMEAMQTLHALSIPTFASCWGFQALAQALGGQVCKDPECVEIGSLPLYLTDEGKKDPVFKSLGRRFFAQVGHEDTVIELPTDAIHLTRSDRVKYHAFRFKDKPIYATQFHPEMRSVDMVERLTAYPHYLNKVAGLSVTELSNQLHPSPEASKLLKIFIKTYL